MLVSNYYDISYLSIGNIMDYFYIDRTSRNYKSMIDCFAIMESEGLINIVYGNDIGSININSLIGLQVDKDIKFNQVHFSEIESIINIYKTKESNYSFANIFLVIKKSSWTPMEGDNTDALDYTRISYSTISLNSGIKSNTTISKCVKLLEEACIFYIERNTEVSELDDGKLDFKTINTYYFKEKSEC